MFWNIFAALVTLKYLLQKNVKCRNLLENDAGGGSVSGSAAVSFLIIYRLRMHMPFYSYHELIL